MKLASKGGILHGGLQVLHVQVLFVAPLSTSHIDVYKRQIHYEAPVEEQNFSTLIEFINAMEVREDDEEFQNPVDLMFAELKERKPNHFAVRQYAKYKLAAGDICSK